MADFYKIIVVALAGIMLSLFLKQNKPDFAVYLSMVVGGILLMFVLGKVSSILEFFNKVLSIGGIDSKMFLVLIKVVVIGYLGDFTSTLAIDTGNTMLSDKVLLASRVMMFIVSMPIVEGLFDVVLELIS